MSVRQALGEPRVFFFGAPAERHRGGDWKKPGRCGAEPPTKNTAPRGEPPRAGGPWKGANKACEPEDSGPAATDYLSRGGLVLPPPTSETSVTLVNLLANWFLHSPVLAYMLSGWLIEVTTIVLALN